MSDFAWKLLELKAPIFRVYKIDGELKTPTGWETTYPGHANSLKLWREGEGLAMVCGQLFDVLDWDPRNDPDKTSYDKLLKILPKVYAIVDTPGGGRHFYIAPLGLAKKQGIFPGVDYQGGQSDGSGRAFVYLPGTVRPHGVYTPVVMPSLPDGSENNEALRSLIEGLRKPAPQPAQKPVQARTDERLTRYGRKALEGAFIDYGATPAGGGDTAAYSLLCRVLELENAGCPVDWEIVKQSFVATSDFRTLAHGASGQAEDWDRLLDQARKHIGDRAAEIPDETPFTVNGQVVHPKGDAPSRVSTDAPTTDVTATGSKIKWLSELEPREIEWLWDGWIPRRGATALYGPGGVGKSTYLAHLGAHVTNGTAPGALEGQPGRVLVFAHEDDYNEIVLPRWAAAGAALDRVGFIDLDHGGLILPDGVEELRELLERHDFTMGIFDPMLTYMRADLSADKAQHVRQVMDPLNAMSKDLGVAFLVLHHINKASGMNTSNRMSGSHAWRDSVRSAVAFGKNSEGDCFFVHDKANAGVKKRPLRYEIDSADVDLKGKTYTTSVFRFCEKADIDPDELFQTDQRGRGRPPSSDTLAVVAAVKAVGSTTLDQLSEQFSLINRPRLKMILSRAVHRGDIRGLGNGTYAA